MDHRKREKICLVCGDVAVGFNFGAIACESCKAFFRRTARKSKHTKCLFNEECKMEVATRRFCAHCRLMKCFKVGMKTCFILDDAIKQARRERVIRQSRPIVLSTSTAITDSSTPITAYSSVPTKPGSLEPRLPFTPNEAKFDGRLPESSSLSQSNLSQFVDNNNNKVVFTARSRIPDDQDMQPIRNAQPNSNTNNNNQWYALINDGPPDYSQQENPPLEVNEMMYGRVTNPSSTTSPFSSHLSASSNGDIRNESTQPQTAKPESSLIASSLQPLFSSEHRPTGPASRPSSTTFITDRTGLDAGQEPMRLLSHYQWTAVHDLRNAYETSFVEDEFCSNLGRSDITLSSLINTSRFLVRRLINFAKTLTDFSQLQQDCQISLLKGVVLSTLFLLSARHYVVEKDVWLTPKGEVSTQILKVATGMDLFYEEHAKYCRDFNALVAQDANLVALMQTLCLFTPDRPSLDARQAVANIHDRYYLLLKHYLEAKAGFSNGRIQLAKVLTNLGQLESLTTNYGHMLMQVDPTKIDPLLLEIFNLTT